VSPVNLSFLSWFGFEICWGQRRIRKCIFRSAGCNEVLFFFSLSHRLCFQRRCPAAQARPNFSTGGQQTTIKQKLETKN